MKSALKQEKVESTEAVGTEYEGLSEEEIERALFDKAVADDPDVEVVAAEKEPEEEPEEPQEEQEAEQGKEVEVKDQPKEEKKPTGLEWLDEIPEDIRTKAQDIINRQGQAIARLDQRVKSHLGQLQPAQRTIAQLQQKLRQMEAQTPESPVIPNVDAKRKAYNDWIDKEYNEFPEEAAKLKKQFSDSLDGVLGELPAPPKPQPMTMAGPDRREEVQHLATAYSDWGERRFSPEFNQWFTTLDADSKQLLNSPYAADNIALLDAFTRDNPDWMPPQTPEAFYSLAQAQHSPLYRGWAQAEGINPDLNLAAVPDYQRDALLTRFKQDLGAVHTELEQANDPKVLKLAQRRSQQLKDRNPGQRRAGIKPGQTIDLDTEEGQRAYFQQLIDADPDLK